MSKLTRASHPLYNLLPTEIEGFDSLAELALDMHWSWNHATDEVWHTLDPILWELTQNPWVVLQTVSRDHIQGVLADPAFRKKINALTDPKQQAAAVRPPADYTARVLPRCDGVAIPLEDAQILWQR